MSEAVAAGIAQSLVVGLLVIFGSIVGARLGEASKIREERRRDARIDSAVRAEILAHVRAEAEQVRLMYVTAIVVLSQLEAIHERLVQKVFDPQTAQAFGPSAAALFDAVSACEWAYRLQRERSRHQASSQSQAQLLREMRSVRGLWTRPFDQLEAFARTIGAADEVAKFGEARLQQAVYAAADL